MKEMIGWQKTGDKIHTWGKGYSSRVVDTYMYNLYPLVLTQG